MTLGLKLSNREKALRKNIIDAIPKFPNDKATRIEMEGKSLGDLFIDYISWRLRLVGMRPRLVFGEDILRRELKDQSLLQGAEQFLEAVKKGDDLTPYLSNKATKRGYTPRSKNSSDVEERWEDKDFLLNVMGCHHFHIGVGQTSSGLVNRTDEVIFARLDRNEFHILGIYDHSVFEFSNSSITPERDRLWKAFSEHESQGNEAGVYISGGYGGLGITMSGHPTIVVGLSMKLAQIVRNTEPKLDDPDFLKSLGFENREAKIDWYFNHLDFGLLDTRSNRFVVLKYGFN